MPDYETRITGLRFAKVLVWLVYLFFLLAVIILTAAFFLQLFNANTDAEFTRWVYRNADRVLEPFRGIFPSVQRDNGSVIDFAVLFAIIMYGIFAMLVNGVVHWLDGKIIEQKHKAIQAQEAAREPHVQWQGTTQYAADSAATASEPRPAPEPQPAPQPQPVPQPQPAPAPASSDTPESPI